MKRITFTIATLFIALLFSCSESDGRDGIDGISGVDGVDGVDGTNGQDGLAPLVFEFYPGGNYDWELNTGLNRYQIRFIPYPNDLIIDPEDVILMYRLEDILDDNTDLWRQMPQPYINDQGTQFFNFDFTVDTFGVFLEAENFDISDLQQQTLLEDEIFKIVLIPASYLNLTSKTDFSNLNSILKAYGLDESEVHRID